MTQRIPFTTKIPEDALSVAAATLEAILHNLFLSLYYIKVVVRSTGIAPATRRFEAASSLC